LFIDTHAQFFISVESGLVSTAYNKTRIPAATGTYIALSDQLSSHSEIYFRTTLNYKIKEKHTLLLLYAPLKIMYSGNLASDLQFKNYLFTQNNYIEATYRFDSYRLTYRYSILNQKNMNLSLGITLKMRDAEISIDNKTHKESYFNTGIVPLIHLYFNWNIITNLAFQIQGDGFAVKQGRAEDFLFGLNYSFNNKLSVYTGYRILEGGSDGSSVYTFAMFHYFANGLTYIF